MENVIFTNTDSVNSRLWKKILVFMADIHFYPDDGTLYIVPEFFKVKEIVKKKKRILAEIFNTCRPDTT